MANGRGNFGFNIGGGGGGIANLVQAPKVTPVRSLQFAPTPRPQIQRDEKDPKKQLLAALLGGIAPSAVDAGLEYLADRSDLVDRLVFRPELDLQEEYGLSDPQRRGLPSQVALDPSMEAKTARLRSAMTGQDIPTTALTEDEYEDLEDLDLLKELDKIPGKYRATGIDPLQNELARRRQLVEQSFSRMKTPRQKSNLGRAIASGLSYAPGFALAGDEDDGSIAAYLGAVGAGSKAEAALDAARLDNFLKRETERSKSLVQIGNFERKIGNGTVFRPNDSGFTPVRRQILISPDKSIQYILSQGDEDVDFILAPDGSRQVVPKGQHYIKRDFVLDPEKLKDPINHTLLVDDVNGKIGTGYTTFARNKDGLVVPTTYVRDDLDGGKAKPLAQMNEEYGDRWHAPQPGFAYKDRDFRGKDPNVEYLVDRDLKTTALFNGLKPLRILTKISLDAAGWNPNTGTFDKDKEDPNIFSAVGELESVYIDFLQEARGVESAVNDLFRAQNRPIVREQIAAQQRRASSQSKDGTGVNYFTKVIDAQLDYDQAIEEQDSVSINETREKYRQALRNFRDNVGNQGGDIGFLDGLDLDAPESWNERAIKRAAILSAQLKLAYASAAQDGSTGVALSDRDVSNYLIQVGFGSRNPLVVLDKAQTTFNDIVGNFDSDLTARKLGVASRSNTQEAVDYIDAQIRGFGVNQKDLDYLKDLKNSETDRQEAWREILVQLNRRSGNQAASHFNYNPKDGRVRFSDVEDILRMFGVENPVLKFFEENLLRANNTSLEKILRGVDNRYFDNVIPFQDQKQQVDQPQGATATVDF